MGSCAMILESANAKSSMRHRLSILPIGNPIPTNSPDITIWEYEGFILEEAIAKFKFGHWGSHIVSVQGRLSGSRLYLVDGDQTSEDNFPRLRDVITKSLLDFGFSDFSRQVETSLTESALNSTLIRQYTEETDFYYSLGQLMREAHSGRDLGTHVIAPWILQFNCAIHLQPAVTKTVFRGVEMSTSDLGRYEIGKDFVWAPFVSASLSEVNCLGGNVIFEISPWGAIDNHEKRDSRAIWMHSAFPNEEEAIYPFCCAFRVIEKNVSRGTNTRIKLSCIDMW